MIQLVTQKEMMDAAIIHSESWKESHPCTGMKIENFLRANSLYYRQLA